MPTRPNRTHAAARLATAAATVAIAALSAACTGNDGSYAGIKSNLTPELDTLYRTPDQVDNKLVRTADVYGRLFWEDLARFGLVDRPSRLSTTNVVE